MGLRSLSGSTNWIQLPPNASIDISAAWKWGNFCNTKPLREGLFELRMDFGPGYRVYFGREGRAIVILVGGGSKHRQVADIAIALERWKRYKQLKAKNGTDTTL